MSSFVSSRIGRGGFWLWIGGVGLVIANWCFWDYYYSHYPTGHGERTFSFVGSAVPPPGKQLSPEARRWAEEGQAIRRERDTFVAWWPSLMFGTVVYGFAGAVLFRRRGNNVFVFASAIALLSLFCGCHLEL
jgi:hypothetical protein